MGEILFVKRKDYALERGERHLPGSALRKGRRKKEI